MTDLNSLKYTAEHEWIAVDGDVATVGITDYAAEKLGDVVFVDLPAVGSTVSAGQVVGEIESTKSVGELFAPSPARSSRSNEAVVDDPRSSTATRSARAGSSRCASTVGARRAARPRRVPRADGRRG